MTPEHMLFSEQWSKASLDQIPWLVQPLSWLAVIIISSGGLLLVILPLIQTVIVAIYTSIPNLCDKIHDAKKRQWNRSVFKGVDSVQGAMAPIQDMFLAMLIDFKALAGPEVTGADPRQYWFKAIPRALGIMMIGVFIANGYTTLIADKMQILGTYALDTVLMSIDPVAWAEKLPTDYVRMSFSTDSARDAESEMISTISASATKPIWSTFDDMKQKSKTTVMHEVEAWVESYVKGLPAEYTDGVSYKYRVTSSVSQYNPDITRTENGSKSTDGNVITYEAKKPVSDFTHGSTISDENVWVKFQLTFTKQAISNKDKVASITLAAKASINGSGSSTKRIIDLGTISQYISSGTASYDYSLEDTKLIINNNKTGLDNVKNLYYTDSNGVRHNITKIVIVESGSITLTNSSKGDSEGNVFTAPNSPFKDVNSEGNSNTNNNTNSNSTPGL